MNLNNQMSIFDFTREPISITKPIRLIELFAGYGSQAMALKRIGAKFEHYRVVEFDKYAIASYNAVHGTDFPTMDITHRIVHINTINQVFFLNIFDTKCKMIRDQNNINKNHS